MSETVQCGCAKTLCPNCDGNGSYSIRRGVTSCGHCNGEGYICNSSTCILPAAVAAIRAEYDRVRLEGGDADAVHWLTVALRALGCKVEGE